MKIKKSLAFLMCMSMAASLTSCGSDAEMEMESSMSKSAAVKEAPVRDEAPMEAPMADVAEAEAAFDGDSSYKVESFGAADIIGSAGIISSADGAGEPSFGDGVEIPVEPDMPYEPEERIGVLTAGEWNDNANWGFFRNLVNNGVIKFPEYCMNVLNRVKVTVKNESGEPVANAKVSLKNGGGEVVWSTESSHDGTAYLLYTNDQADDVAEVIAAVGDVEAAAEVEMKFADAQGNGQSEAADVEIVLNTETESREKTQVMFILDTTGSMGDEMLFLQSEFGAIAREVGSDGIEWSVNFYRDEGDEYVTKCNGFTADTSEIVSLLNAESADGGGDYPEAVDKILNETMGSADWDSGAVKVAFMIFDAPPHEGTGAELEKAVRAASEKGIHIVPVVSSDSDRDTEIFARSLSIATNGTYVFLTDDSGVGNSHLEPIIGDYEVELLQDIIIRTIKSYQQ